MNHGSRMHFKIEAVQLINYQPSAVCKNPITLSVLPVVPNESGGQQFVAPFRVWPKD